MASTRAADEGRHAPTDHPLWEEAWHLDFATADGGFGGHVRLGILPNQGLSWVWCAVVGDGRRLVTVVEPEAPVPRRGSLDLRCEGLWTDFVCEEPLEHWSVGVEAFGVALDDPADAVGDLRGERVGVGLDLGWETVGPVRGDPAGGRYDLACDVSGEVLVGDEVIAFDGWGSRHHTWGVAAWWGARTTSGAGRLDDGTRWDLHVDQAEAPVAGAAEQPDDALAPGARAGDDRLLGGIPARGRLPVEGLELRYEVRHLSPIPVAAPDGRSGAVVHGLCRTTTGDGRTGAAWLVWGGSGARA